MVVLGPEVFAEIPTADLIVMLWLGLRHRVVVLDDLAPAYLTWLPEGLDAGGPPRLGAHCRRRS